MVTSEALSLHSALARIASEYSAATASPFTGNALAAFIRTEAPVAQSVSMGEAGQGLLSVGSAGISRWSDSPWLAVLDPLVTETPQSGYYAAWLFPRSLKWVVLSLQVGTTAIRQRFGSGEAARRQLRAVAEVMRSAVPKYQDDFSPAAIALEPDLPSSRAAFYEAAHVFGATYQMEELPSDEVLSAALQRMVYLYRLITARAGDEIAARTVVVSDDVVETAAPGDGAGVSVGASKVAEGDPTGWENTGRWRMHRRVERNRRLAKLVKKALGYRCQACGFDFEKSYGKTLGSGYIEAHHLTPLAELEPGHAVKLDARKDFAVLCANCHAMIHRRADPTMSLEELKSIIATQASGPARLSPGNSRGGPMAS